MNLRAKGMDVIIGVDVQDGLANRQIYLLLQKYYFKLIIFVPLMI